MQELEQVGENIDAIRRIALSKFANEQSSPCKRKLQPGSSLETNGQNRSCRFKKSKKPQRVIKRIKSQMKMVEAMFERTPEYFRQFQKLFQYFICNSEPHLDSNLTKTSHTASTKMKIIANYNNFITMSLLLLINYRSPSRILLLNHIQYHFSSLVFNCSFGGLLT